MEKRTVSLDLDICNTLKRMGKMGDTYNDVIRRLVKEKEDKEARKK